MTFSRLGGRLLREEHTHAQVAITAFALGLAAGSAGLCAILVNVSGHPRCSRKHQQKQQSQRYRGLAFYVALLALFHLLEYVTTAMHRLDVSMKAFMLNHSPQYKIALAAGLVEYCLEAVFWPGLKVWRWWNWVGVALVLACQVLRSLAMLTAGANFTHLISFHKERGHVLVTDGIYKVFRHPSYTAFFYYGPCLQLGVLMNPIAFVANVIVLWRFFQDRIGVEEETLVEFFGQEYEAYRTRSYIFIPFIK
ncbi:Isoprenylcysteine carboxyl methyltransferase family-domain-containing protein [Chytriomyces sp. MP71]|nr:Isoprenylcysteine carboxyl methyltransferase family-domain-containing protein [Chytriomyces sp. MP71]